MITPILGNNDYTDFLIKVNEVLMFKQRGGEIKENHCNHLIKSVQSLYKIGEIIKIT